MNINFLKKKTDMSFVKKDFFRNPKKDWLFIIATFFGLFVVIFGMSIYLFYLVNNENLVSAGAGSNDSQPKLESIKLERVSKIILDRKTNKELLINSKTKVLDPSL